MEKFETKSSMKIEEFRKTETETQISKRICDYVKGLGHRIYRMNAGRVKVKGGWFNLNEPGTPDLLIIAYGIPCFVEVKKQGEKPTETQQAYHEKLRDEKIYIFSCDSFRAFETHFGGFLYLAKTWRKAINDFHAECRKQSQSVEFEPVAKKL
jgi:hypothetical protein